MRNGEKRPIRWGRFHEGPPKNLTFSASPPQISELAPPLRRSPPSSSPFFLAAGDRSRPPSPPRRPKSLDRSNQSGTACYKIQILLPVEELLPSILRRDWIVLYCRDSGDGLLHKPRRLQVQPGRPLEIHRHRIPPRPEIEGIRLLFFSSFFFVLVFFFLLLVVVNASVYCKVGDLLWCSSWLSIL